MNILHFYVLIGIIYIAPHLPKSVGVSIGMIFLISSIFADQFKWGGGV